MLGLGMGAILFLSLRVPGVAAHAELMRSEPAAGAVLASPPTQVRLWFSEPIEAEFNALLVVDGAGVRQDLGNGRVAADDVRRLETDLRPLAQGTHTVRWRVLSTDGHVVGGAFQFSVGAPSDGGAGIEQGNGGPLAAEALLRWLTLLATVLLVGGATFRLFVLQPAAQDLAPDSPEAALLTRAEFDTVALARWAALALVVLSVAVLLYQVSQVAGVSILQAMDGSLVGRVVLQTRYGMVWLARMVLIVALMGVLDHLAIRAAGQRDPAPQTTGAAVLGTGAWWWASALLGAGLLLTLSLTSHASGRDPALLAVLADWLHLLGAVLWLGGLLHGAALLRHLAPLREPSQRYPERVEGRVAVVRALLPALSRTGAVALVVLAATGMLNAWLEVVAPANLLSTDYGRALLLKQVVLAPMLALAALHLLFLGPRLAGQRLDASKDVTARTSARVVRTVPVEAGLGVVALLVVGVLSSIPPAPLGLAAGAPGPAAQASTPAPGVSLAQAAGEGLVVLRVSPADVGRNTLVVVLQDAVGQPVRDATVDVRLAGAGTSGATVIALAPQGDGYTTVADLPSAGRWQLDVRARLPGQPDSVASFFLSLPLPGARLRLAQAEAAMNGLAALKERQELRGSSGGAALTTEYTYAAPDAVSFQAEGGPQGVIIGPARYSLTPGQGWGKTELPPQLQYRFPSFRYTQGATDVAVVAREPADGVESDVLAFYQPATGAYFRLWIGVDDHLVRRTTMTAPGHYMTSAYREFNVPNSIVPPQ
ncbi:MAG: copper resistance protein CopC [Chloroflexi bacterium]|nr:copper resistance protein CopC [Chloroflexota bacterium]